MTWWQIVCVAAGFPAGTVIYATIKETCSLGINLWKEFQRGNISFEKWVALPPNERPPSLAHALTLACRSEEIYTAIEKEADAITQRIVSEARQYHPGATF